MKEENLIFSRREFQANKFNDAKKLDKELGREATFKDFITDIIKKTNYSSVKEKFDSYKYVWNLIGRDISNAEQVFEEFFVISNHRTREEVYQEIDNIIEGITEHPYNTNVIYEDLHPLGLNKKLINCEKCNSSFESYADSGFCKRCVSKKKKLQEEKPNEFIRSIYSGILISVVVATIWNWISPDDFSWVEKFSGFFIIGVVIAKMISK